MSHAHRLWQTCFVLLSASHTVALLNAPCSTTAQCSRFEHCDSGACRLGFCYNDVNCQDGEYCTQLQDGSGTGACKLRKKQQPPNDNSCPGGSLVLQNGVARQCNVNNPCSSAHICNPIAGVCCTALRVCRTPLRPAIDTATQKPRMCFSNNSTHLCPDDGTFCESLTGFCCIAPLLKQACAIGRPCASPNSRCECDTNGVNCQCKCEIELGYTQQSDGTCKRSRRRLQEQCVTTAECSAAFAECYNNRCRCRNGFQQDSKGGCVPLSYNCANGLIPLRQNGRVVQCDLALDVEAWQACAHFTFDIHLELQALSRRRLPGDLTSPVSNTCERKEAYMRDSCPSNYHCVAYYDLPEQVDHRRGICCPKRRNDPPPPCPVGIAHPSCQKCPVFGYFCHEDRRASSKQACCPTPCINPSDLYADGMCWPIAAYGEQCEADVQCVGVSDGELSSIDSPGNNMACIQGTCRCQAGFINVNSKCIRAMCTIGMKSEPLSSVDGLTLRCNPNSVTGQCPPNASCDPTFGVCCKTYQQQPNRCPSGYKGTGAQCQNGYGCRQYEVCAVTDYNNGIQIGVCCAFDWSQIQWQG